MPCLAFILTQRPCADSFGGAQNITGINPRRQPAMVLPRDFLCPASRLHGLAVLPRVAKGCRAPLSAAPKCPPCATAFQKRPGPAGTWAGRGPGQHGGCLLGLGPRRPAWRSQGREYMHGGPRCGLAFGRTHGAGMPAPRIHRCKCHRAKGFERRAPLAFKSAQACPQHSPARLHV